MVVHGGVSVRRFDGLAQAWLEAIGCANTRDAYRRDVAAFRAWCVAGGQSPLQVGPDEVGRFRDACCDDGLQRGTIIRRLSALSSFFDHAVAEAAVTVNPVNKVCRPASPDCSPPAGLDEAQAAALYAAATALGPKVMALVSLLLWDGMKLGEAVALDVDSVQRRGRTTRALVERRGGISAIKLDDRSARAIRQYLDGRSSGPLLLGDSPTHPAGSRLTRFGAGFLIKQAAERAGLSGSVSANTLRRSYIGQAQRDGTSVEDIQRHVGHANVRDTRRYLA